MTDAYKIGISVVLGNLMSAELLKIVGQLGIADKAAMSFAAKVSVVGGAVAVFGTVLKGGVEEARKFQLEATRFATLGFGDAINEQAQSFAKGMKSIGTSSTENMALLSDAMAVFKNLGEAEIAAPLMAKMKFANETLYGSEAGSANDRKFMDMLKVIEFRGGLKSNDQFAEQANFVQKVINGSRNRVDATQMLNALKTGGVALAGMSNEAFYLGSEPLIQEFGGARYGTANMSAYQNLVMMRTTQQAMTEMMRLGLLDSSKVKMNKFTGQVKKVQPGTFKGANVLEEQGDLAFLEQVLLPAFAAKGITSDKAIIEEIGRIFSNRTASGLFVRVYQQRASLDNQSEANKSAMDIGQTADAAAGTFDGQVHILSAEWKKLEQRIGETILPSLISVLKAINGGFEWLETSPMVSKLFNEFAGANDNGKPTSWTGFFDQKLGFDTSKAVPQGQSQAITLDHQTFLDGRVLAESTTKYQVNGLATVSPSGNNYDLRMTPMILGH